MGSHSGGVPPLAYGDRASEPGTGRARQRKGPSAVAAGAKSVFRSAIRGSKNNNGRNIEVSRLPRPDRDLIKLPHFENDDEAEAEPLRSSDFCCGRPDALNLAGLSVVE
jgi:hypothetical protein